MFGHLWLNKGTPVSILTGTGVIVKVRQDYQLHYAVSSFALSYPSNPDGWSLPLPYSGNPLMRRFDFSAS